MKITALTKDISDAVEDWDSVLSTFGGGKTSGVLEELVESTAKEKTLEEKEKKPKNPPGKVYNCGRYNGYAFCMAFVFTKKGLMRYCGSFDKIIKQTITLDLCHGVVHYYNFHKVVRKKWRLFGSRSIRMKSEQRFRFSLKKIRSGRSSVPSYLQHILGEPKQTRYYLIVYDVNLKEYDVLASWRKLPSSYIKEFNWFWKEHLNMVKEGE